MHAKERFLNIYICVFLCVYLCHTNAGTYRSQKRVSDPLGQEFQTVWIQGSKVWKSRDINC